MAEFEKTNLNLKVSLDLDNELTWRELFQFVDLARDSGHVDPDARVGLARDDFQDETTITGLYVYVDSMPNGAAPRQHQPG